MTRLALFLSIAFLTFAIGVYATTQVNRAGHYIWPDIDPQPQVIAADPPVGKKLVLFEREHH